MERRIAIPIPGVHVGAQREKCSGNLGCSGEMEGGSSKVVLGVHGRTQVDESCHYLRGSREVQGRVTRRVSRIDSKRST